MALTRLQAQAIRRGAELTRSMADDIRRLREDAGVSQRQLQLVSGVDQSVISRIESGTLRPTLETYTRLAAGLGGDLALRLYPNTGPAIRDRHQAPIVEALVAALDRRWSAYPEVGVRQPVRGWIDLVLADRVAAVLVAVEVESTMRRFEQTIRWATAKSESVASTTAWPFGIAGQVTVGKLLVVRDTASKRHVLALTTATLRAAYPGDAWQALSALRGEASWPGAAVLWARKRDTGTIELMPQPRQT